MKTLYVLATLLMFIAAGINFFGGLWIHSLNNISTGLYMVAAFSVGLFYRPVLTEKPPRPDGSQQQ